MRVVNVAVEGATDLAVISKVLEEAGLIVGNVYGQNGKRHLDSCLAGFNNSAKYRPWVVVRDLDRDATCATELVAALLPRPARLMCLRIATRAIESWLLADADALARFLSIRPDRVPAEPDLLDDPKATLINLVRTSPRRALVEDLVPPPGTARRVGPGYTVRISEFATRHWRPRVASRRSDSLRRCVDRVRELVNA